MSASDAYDVVVIGAGAGGMTAAAVAAAEGLSVFVIEKTEFVGGTTAWSGGMVWIPVNGKMKQAGIDDSLSVAADYLASTVPEAENADLRKTFLARGPEAIEYLEANTEIRLQPVKIYPDYYPQMPGATAGGRVLEPVSFEGARLGANFRRLRPPLPEFTLFGGMMVNRLDIPHLRKFGRSFRSSLRAMRLVWQYAWQRLGASRGTTLHLGNALAARLYASLLARNVEFLFGATVEQLLVEGGAITGVAISETSGIRKIVARKGVVLATGGFSHDKDLRERLFPAAAGFVSAASPAGNGDGLRIAVAAGASLGTSVASPAYWVPASLFQRADGSPGVFPHTVTDRAKPGVIAVNASGKRFVNEALSYHEFVLAMLRDGNDAANRAFQRYVKSGELIEAASIDALADSLRVERSALSTTLDNYNAPARAGLDPEFGRGTTIYQRHLGDAGHAPNPCVAPIEQAPFYALRIFPADLGTAIGLKTDCHARVLRNNGAVIAGLYACGNDMGSIMNGNYPGPGITLGPALTFGYIAGRHLAHIETEARAQEKGRAKGQAKGQA
jgi:succinate dehydrogenase/fumarate reductase flavoprotein subunit